MNVLLNNIGMIQSADVKLNGLTVIAGENDTGKSTVGKMLFATIKVDNIHRKANKQQRDPKALMTTWLNLVFDGNVSDSAGVFRFFDKKKRFIELEIQDKNDVKRFDFHSTHDARPLFDVTLIQSPIVLDLDEFFGSVMRLRETQRMEMGYVYKTAFEFSYPVILWDLYRKINDKNPFPKADTWKIMGDNIFNVIKGEIKKENGKFLYKKQVMGEHYLNVEIANTAFGIKSFGLLQLLNDNGYLNKKYLLILDEPEIHLHPEWQVKYAELIIELVKNGIYVLVNSHSPYMIQALKFYSDKQQEIKEKTSFYLAEKKEDNYHSVIVDKTQDLNAIFQKLAKPMNEIVWG